FVLRMWLPYQWLSAGVAKQMDPGWMTTRAPLQEFLTSSLTTSPRPVIAYDWYRAFIEALVAGGHHVWFPKMGGYWRGRRWQRARTGRSDGIGRRGRTVHERELSAGRARAPIRPSRPRRCSSCSGGRWRAGGASIGGC